MNGTEVCFITKKESWLAEDSVDYKVRVPLERTIRKLFKCLKTSFVCCFAKRKKN